MDLPNDVMKSSVLDQTVFHLMIYNRHLINTNQSLIDNLEKIESHLNEVHQDNVLLRDKVGILEEKIDSIEKRQKINLISTSTQTDRMSSSSTACPVCCCESSRKHDKCNSSTPALNSSTVNLQTFEIVTPKVKVSRRKLSGGFLFGTISPTHHHQQAFKFGIPPRPNSSQIGKLTTTSTIPLSTTSNNKQENFSSQQTIPTLSSSAAAAAAGTTSSSSNLQHPLAATNANSINNNDSHVLFQQPSETMTNSQQMVENSNEYKKTFIANDGNKGDVKFSSQTTTSSSSSSSSSSNQPLSKPSFSLNNGVGGNNIAASTTVINSFLPLQTNSTNLKPFSLNTMMNNDNHGWTINQSLATTTTGGSNNSSNFGNSSSSAAAVGHSGVIAKSIFTLNLLNDCF